MNRTARIQSVAGAATVAALPILYIGGVHQMLPVTAIGFAVFTVGMLTTPALRFLPRRAEPEISRTAASTQPADQRPSEEVTATQESPDR